MEESNAGTDRSSRLPPWFARHARRCGWPEVVLILGFVASLAISAYFTHDMWFVRDDWDYLTRRGTVPGENRGWFAPYGGHWVTIPVVAYRLVFAVFGMHTYLPYALMAIGAHLAVAALLYLLLRQVAVGRWLAVAVTWLVLFLGAGAEAFLWDAAMPLSGSLACGLGASLVLFRTAFSRKGLMVAAGLLVVSIMFSGVGLTVVVLVGVLVVARRGPFAAVGTLAPALILYAIWYLATGHTQKPALHDDTSHYLVLPLYVWTGLSDALGNASAIPGAGAALLLALVATLVLARGVPEELRLLSWAGFFAAVVQLLLSGTARLLTSSVEQAATGRYAFLVVVLLTPAIASALLCLIRSIPAGPRLMPVALGMVLLLAYTVNGVALERSFAAEASANARGWKERVSGLLVASQAGQRILSTRPDNWLEADFNPKLVLDPAIRSALPDLPAAPTDRLEAERRYFVGVGDETFGLFRPAEIEFKSGFTTPFRPGKQCAGYMADTGSPELTLPTGAGNEISVLSESTKITTRLTRGEFTSGPTEWPVEPGAIHIATTAKDATLMVSFDRGGDYVICTH